MPDLKTHMRVTAVFRAFADARKPLRLSDLAAALSLPVSSCFALIKALVEEGYLYELSKRSGYYPTGRMHEHTLAVNAHDPLLERIGGVLERLRDQTVETITLGRCVGKNLVYVTGFESPSSVRLAVLAGATRPLHANAMGKALLSSMSPEARRELLRGGRLERLTANTITSAAKLEVQIEKMAKRGWFTSVSESTDGGAAVAVPLDLPQGLYALQAAGPLERIKQRFPEHAESLRRARSEIERLLKQK
jgi:DNA-binding IclR family transcriptional regulator